MCIHVKMQVKQNMYLLRWMSTERLVKGWIWQQKQVQPTTTTVLSSHVMDVVMMQNVHNTHLGVRSGNACLTQTEVICFHVKGKYSKTINGHFHSEYSREW